MSLGGLVRGLNEEQILHGVSESRNRRLGNIFFRLGRVEAYGTGIPRIFETYDGTGLQPVVKIFDNAFDITLPNLNYAASKREKDIFRMSDAEKKIVAYLENNATITKDGAAELIRKKPDTAYRILESLVSSGFIEAGKNGRKAEYFLVSK